jgi:hypothetical protein
MIVTENDIDRTGMPDTTGSVVAHLLNGPAQPAVRRRPIRIHRSVLFVLFLCIGWWLTGLLSLTRSPDAYFGRFFISCLFATILFFTFDGKQDPSWGNKRLKAFEK